MMKKWYATTWIAFALWLLIGVACNYPHFFDRPELTKMPSLLPPGMNITLVNGSGMPTTYLSYEADMPACKIRLRTFSPLRLTANICLLAAVLIAIVYSVPRSFSLRTTFLVMTIMACCVAAAAAAIRQPLPASQPPVLSSQNGVVAAPPVPTLPIDLLPGLMIGIYFAPIPIAVFLRLRCMLSSDRTNKTIHDRFVSGHRGTGHAKHR